MQLASAAAGLLAGSDVDILNKLSGINATEHKELDRLLYEVYNGFWEIEKLPEEHCAQAATATPPMSTAAGSYLGPDSANMRTRYDSRDAFERGFQRGVKQGRLEMQNEYMLVERQMGSSEQQQEKDPRVESLLSQLPELQTDLRMARYDVEQLQNTITIMKREGLRLHESWNEAVDAAWDHGWRPPPDVSEPEDRRLYDCAPLRKFFESSLQELVGRWGSLEDDDGRPSYITRDIKLDFFTMSDFESDGEE